MLFLQMQENYPFVCESMLDIKVTSACLSTLETPQ